MGRLKDLEPTDIMAEVEAAEAEKPDATPQPTAPALREPDPAPDIEELKRLAAQAATGKPSHYEADLRAKLRDKSNFHLGQVPTFVKEAYIRQARKKKMTQRQFLYHLLRELGEEIPPDDQMDARRL